MRLSCMLFAALLFTAGTACAQLPASVSPSTQTWTDYRPTGGGFTIQVPGTPKISSQTVETSLGPIEARNAALDLGNTAYYVSYNIYPLAHVNRYTATRILEGVRDGQAKGKTLVSDRQIDINNRPARELVLVTAQFVMLTRITLSGQRLIQVIYVGAPGTETSADARRFADSLALHE